MWKMGGMGMKTGRQLARELVLENKDVPSLTLAKMLYKLYPFTFNSVECARESVRVARGASGKKRIHLAVASRSKVEQERCKGLSAIKADETSFKVVMLSGADKWLILPDIHAPYHDLQAIEVAVAQGKKERCNGIIYNGDLSDCYKLSNFTKDPLQRNFTSEIEIVKQLIYEIGRIIKPSATIWKMGNHENRLNTILCQKAPELFGLPSLSYESIYELEKLNVRAVGRGDLLRYNTLTIGHGDEIGSVSSAYPARGVFMRTGACTLVSHWHRSSTYTETDINGEIKTCWSTGCLCNKHPEYAPVNKWNSGFATLETNGKYWEIKNKSIIKSRVFEG